MRLPQIGSEIGHVSAAAHTTNPAVTAWWRRSLDEHPAQAELWLYRNDPELGVNVHAPTDLEWADSVGTRLVRHSVYWHIPIEEALAQLSHAVARAPDGAALLVVVHSKEVCVDYSVAGERLATYQRYTDYVRRLAAMAPRSGRVRVLYWQIYNEPNHSGWTNMFGGPKIDGRDTTCAGDGVSEYVQGRRYAELLRMVYPAIKNATSDSGWVVMGGLGSIDTSTNVYSSTGRYAFLHGMYAGGAREYYDIAAIQPYGDPGVMGMRRTSDFDRALAMYGDEARPVFMTEFGSKKPQATQWSDLREQIESARSTRLYGKAFIFVMCGSDEPYSLRLSVGSLCDTRSDAFARLHEQQYNSHLYGADSVVRTDVVIHRSSGSVEAVGYAQEEHDSRFVIRDVAVHYREPTRIRFRLSGEPPGAVGPGIQYRVFVERYGWTEWVSDSAPAGAAGESVPIQALQARIVNDSGARAVYSVFQSKWTGWVANGNVTGDTVANATGLRAMLASVDGRRLPGMTVCYQTAGTDGSWSVAGCDGAETSVPPSVAIGSIRMWLRR